MTLSIRTAEATGDASTRRSFPSSCCRIATKIPVSGADSADSEAFPNTKPSTAPPPAPTHRVLHPAGMRRRIEPPFDAGRDSACPAAACAVAPAPPSGHLRRAAGCPARRERGARKTALLSGREAIWRVFLVLGGDGFCGWPTGLYLSRRGHDVAIVDNLSRRKIDVELEVEVADADPAAFRAPPGLARGLPAARFDSRASRSARTTIGCSPRSARKNPMLSSILPSSARRPIR